jgi:hypothetical protein
MPVIMGTYRIGSLSPQPFAVPDREMESRYYAMVGQKGRFEIGGILPGMHKTVIVASVPGRHKGIDHHDPAEDPSESGDENPRAQWASLCQRYGGQALYSYQHHRRCPEPDCVGNSSQELNPIESIC